MSGHFQFCDLHFRSSQYSFSDYDLWLEELKINAIAPLAALRAFTPLLLLSTEKKVVFLTSGMGSLSIAANMPFLGDTYSTTKAALNMGVKKAGAAMTTAGVPITLLLIHPGKLPLSYYPFRIKLLTLCVNQRPGSGDGYGRQFCGKYRHLCPRVCMMADQIRSCRDGSASTHPTSQFKLSMSLSLVSSR